MKVLNQYKPVIGMLHVPALPGTPGNTLRIDKIIDHVLREAEIYAGSNLNALLIENMHDVPYLKNDVGEEIVAAMTAVSFAVKQRFDLPCGIQILAAANKAALAVALTTGLEFIRAEGYVYAHVADEGYIESCAAGLLRYRKALEASHVAIFTDIKKKHSSHSITADVSLAETAKTAEFYRSDGLIITGGATGEPVAEDDLTALRPVTSLPLIVGSGVSCANISTLWNKADAFIVGSHFKQDGLWSQPLSRERVTRFMEQIRELHDG